MTDTNAIIRARGFQDKLERFIAGQEYDFGFVLSESAVDWALIDVPSRGLGKNIVSIL